MPAVAAARREESKAVAIAGRVVVLVVGFRNPGDIVACLQALAEAQPDPSAEVFIAENGGPAAVDALLHQMLDAGHCRIVPNEAIPTDPELMPRRWRLVWNRPDGTPRLWLNVAEIAENVGYAGGVNAWLRPLLQVPGWDGAWILNPDAEPSPTALAELVAYARIHGKGMVGSRLTVSVDSTQIHSRGLAWRKLIAKTEAVDYHAPITLIPTPDEVDARLDSPSGASLYVTRAMIETIGLMDDRYFLYFEDLDWGLRAKAAGGIGYAHASIVPHAGGTTTRTSDRRTSTLTTYLEFRNRILFVRSHYPRLLSWTIAMQVLHAAAFVRAGSFASMKAALRGLVAGVRGEVGRPDHILEAWRRNV
jgi:GT2 family glycosyltransferase